MPAARRSAARAPAGRARWKNCAMRRRSRGRQRMSAAPSRRLSGKSRRRTTPSAAASREGGGRRVAPVVPRSRRARRKPPHAKEWRTPRGSRRARAASERPRRCTRRHRRQADASGSASAEWRLHLQAAGASRPRRATDAPRTLMYSKTCWRRLGARRKCHDVARVSTLLPRAFDSFGNRRARAGRGPTAVAPQRARRRATASRAAAAAPALSHVQRSPRWRRRNEAARRCRAREQVDDGDTHADVALWLARRAGCTARVRADRRSVARAVPARSRDSCAGGRATAAAAEAGVSRSGARRCSPSSLERRAAAAVAPPDRWRRRTPRERSAARR